jgi:predicted outer membrane repeat protein
MSGDCLSWATACDLQTALGLAGSGNAIYVGAGTYYPTTTSDRSISFQMESGVTILGGFPAAGGIITERNWLTNVTTLSANIGDPALETDNSYHVVKNEGIASTAVLDGFVITGGYADLDDDYDWHGAGILNISSSPTFTRLLISDNEVTNGSGGGMYSYQSSPTLNQVTFSANHANSGGGMYNEEGTITVTNSTFEDNESHSQGAGMQNEACTVSLTNVKFLRNAAFDSGADGGGMANYYSTNATLTNVTFTENSASYYGGGILKSGGTLTITNSSFTDNTADRGGGIYSSNGSTSISSSTFSGNEALVYGGGIYAILETISLTDVDFGENLSTQRGGGYMASSCVSELERINFFDNSVEDMGGGMYVEYGTTTLTDVTFDGNESLSYGGGMANYGSSPNLTNVTFVGNDAPNGGGLSNFMNSHPRLYNITFSGNTATNGAAIYNFQSILEIYSATLTLNIASGQGGGIYSTTTNEITMVNSIVWGNSPQVNQIIDDSTSYSVISYSDIEGGWSEVGNINTDPHLLPLADNGGFTLTHGLPYQSAAVDAGSIYVGYKLYDQRGFTRPYDGDGDGDAIADMGAFEFGFVMQLFFPLLLR